MLESERIVKIQISFQRAPNLEEYEAARGSFSWDAARKLLAGFPDGSLNLAYEAVDRHVAAGRGDKTAYRFISREGNASALSFSDLKTRTNQFANVLRSLGVTRGDRVFTLLGRTPELYIAALGALKGGCVFSPLFSAFGAEPIAARMAPGEGKVLVTTVPYYLQKVASIRSELPALQAVLLIGDPIKIANIAGAHDLLALLNQAATEFDVVPTMPDEMALLHFTSGTTGKPKGAILVHEAAVVHLVTGRYVLDLQPDDIFWCTADPGWVTGTSYGIFSPLLNGVTSIVDEGEFDATRWYELLAREEVSVWYTAPTAIRMLMRGGVALARTYSFPKLRLIGGVGEPLNPEAVTWGNAAFGLPIHDNWWQTETGGIMIANFPALDIKPGSMGKPIPGIAAAIVKRGDDGVVEEVKDINQEGELALKRGWPSMGRGYLNQPDKYEKCFGGE